ncbi:MAG: HD domain-containing protein [Candidatus Nanoarchaeia archaeon]
MIAYQKIINTYFKPGSLAHKIYMNHVTLVTKKALEVAKRVPELDPNIEFIEEAAMLHDIGICKVNAPGLGCFGKAPYIQHTILGKEILEKEGLFKHAHICVHHNIGLSKKRIIQANLPLPHKDMIPATIEEEIICFADKFFTKMPNRKNPEMSIKEIKEKIKNHHPKNVIIFEHMCKKFKEPNT